MSRGVTKFMPDVMDKVIRLAELGTPSQEIGDMVGFDRSGVSRIRGAYAAAKDGDVAKLKSLPYQSNVIQWAAAKFGLSLEEPTPIPETPAVLPAPAPETVDAAMLLDAIQEMIRETRATRDAMESVASAVSRTNGALANIEQALHNESKQTRDYINANSDILYKPLEAMQNTLVSIQRQLKK